MSIVQTSPFGNVVQSVSGSVSFQAATPAVTSDSMVVPNNTPPPMQDRPATTVNPVEKSSDSSTSRSGSSKLVDVYL